MKFQSLTIYKLTETPVSDWDWQEVGVHYDVSVLANKWEKEPANVVARKGNGVLATMNFYDDYPITILPNMVVLDGHLEDGDVVYFYRWELKSYGGVSWAGVD